jgi:hypothetical protein
MLGGFETALLMARAREDRAAVDSLIPLLERILGADWRAGNRAVIAAHVHDDPSRLDLTVPLTWGTQLTALTLMFLNERNLTAPSAYLEAAKAQSEANTSDVLRRCVVGAEALAAGDPAELASAIDEAEAHGLVPHAARMRIVLAQRTGDRAQLERARPVLERLAIGSSCAGWRRCRLHLSDLPWLHSLRLQHRQPSKQESNCLESQGAG